MRPTTIVVAAALFVTLAGGFPASHSETAEKGSAAREKKDWLKALGLKKAWPGDVDVSKPLQFNSMTTPMYTEDGTRLSEEELARLLNSGDYVAEPYMDEKKEIKAFVLRPVTEKERKTMGLVRRSGPREVAPVGREARPFSVKDLGGEAYSLERLKGRIVVLNFWFVECQPCRDEIPHLNELVAEYGGNDVTFLALANNGSSRLRKFLKKVPFEYAVVPDSEPIAADYGVAAYPTHIVIGRDGRITYFASGLSPTTASDLKGEIERLLGR